MPEWLQVLAALFPFQATTFSPVAIYLGVVQGPCDLAGPLVIAVGWVGDPRRRSAAVLAPRFNRLIVQGG